MFLLSRKLVKEEVHWGWCYYTATNVIYLKQSLSAISGVLCEDAGPRRFSPAYW
jgi:hypothetical protein